MRTRATTSNNNNKNGHKEEQQENNKQRIIRLCEKSNTLMLLYREIANANTFQFNSCHKFELHFDRNKQQQHQIQINLTNTFESNKIG